MAATTVKEILSWHLPQMKKPRAVKDICKKLDLEERQVHHALRCLESEGKVTQVNEAFDLWMAKGES